MTAGNGKPVIVLDAGMVLIDFDNDILLQSLSELCGRPVGFPLPEQVQDLCVRQEKGACSMAELADGLNSFLGLSLTAEEWRRLWCSIFVGEVPGMRETLQGLKEKYTLVAMSNTCDVHWDFLLERFPIFGLLDGCVLSYAEGTVKPDADIYQTVMARFCGGRPPFFYTDDVEKYVNAAHALEWPAAVFQDAEKFQRDVAGLA